MLCFNDLLQGLNRRGGGVIGLGLKFAFFFIRPNLAKSGVCGENISKLRSETLSKPCGMIPCGMNCWNELWIGLIRFTAHTTRFCLLAPARLGVKSIAPFAI